MIFRNSDKTNTRRSLREWLADVNKEIEQWVQHMIDQIESLEN
jgi:hypothetical protein